MYTLIDYFRGGDKKQYGLAEYLPAWEVAQVRSRLKAAGQCFSQQHTHVRNQLSKKAGGLIPTGCKQAGKMQAHNVDQNLAETHARRTHTTPVIGLSIYYYSDLSFTRGMGLHGYIQQRGMQWRHGNFKII